MNYVLFDRPTNICCTQPLQMIHFFLKIKWNNEYEYKIKMKSINQKHNYMFVKQKTNYHAICAERLPV